MNIVIIGRTATLFKTMEDAIKEGHNIVGIITCKEAPEYKVTREDYRLFAEQNGIPFLATPKLDTKEALAFIEQLEKADISLSMNFSGIIPPQVTDFFPLGILNAHGGDLPRYRGNACQAWAIINGEGKIAMCIHKMVGNELDSGLIISRDYYPIDMNSRIQDVYDWFDVVTPYLFLVAVNKLSTNQDYFLDRQSLNVSDALRCYPRLPEDGEIDWKLTNEQIIRLIGASSEPYAGAFSSYRDKVIRIWRAELVDDDENYLAIPGQISKIDRINATIDVICGVGKIRILDLQCGEFRGAPTFLVKSIRSRFK